MKKSIVSVEGKDHLELQVQGQAKDTVTGWITRLPVEMVDSDQFAKINEASMLRDVQAVEQALAFATAMHNLALSDESALLSQEQKQNLKEMVNFIASQTIAQLPGQLLVKHHQAAIIECDPCVQIVCRSPLSWVVVGSFMPKIDVIGTITKQRTLGADDDHYTFEPSGNRNEVKGFTSTAGKVLDYVLRESKTWSTLPWGV